MGWMIAAMRNKNCALSSLCEPNTYKFTYCAQYRNTNVRRKVHCFIQFISP
jgi:hypothetical protein